MLTAVRRAVDAGELAVSLPERVVVTPAREREHGDYATPLAMVLAKQAARPPREVADVLAARLRSIEGIGAVAVAGPGFLNMTLEDSALGEIARSVVAADKRYGHGDGAAGQMVNLEFVSANPTGPVHIGGVRWAAVGDALARLLEATGADVTREYYFNDAGAQIDLFAATLYAAARGEADARGRVRRCLRRRPCRRGRSPRAGRSRPAGGAGSRGLSAGGHRGDVCRDQEEPGRLRGALRRLRQRTRPACPWRARRGAGAVALRRADV